jgi:homocysteine S-methyltransferase
MGTELLAAGIPLSRCFEELNVTEPERILAIHTAYLEAGAQVIETNTFGANAVRLEQFGFAGRVAEFNRAGAQLARQAARDYEAVVAGSVGPLGMDARTAASRGIDRAVCFREQIVALLDSAAEVIVLETFTDFDEMAVALKATQDVADCLTICLFAVDARGRLRCGSDVPDALTRISDAGADVVGINCVEADLLTAVIEKLPHDLLLAAYPSGGHLPVNRYSDNPKNADHLAAIAQELANRGARLVGGCCGTTSAHIRAVAGRLARFNGLHGARTAAKV